MASGQRFKWNAYLNIKMTSPEIIVCFSSLTDNHLDVPGLDPLTEYEWLVSATDDHSQTTSGPVWSRSSQLRLSTVATVPVRMIRFRS